MPVSPDEIGVYLFNGVAVPVLKAVPCVFVSVIGSVARRFVRPVKAMRTVGTIGYFAGGIFIGLGVYFLSWVWSGVSELLFLYALVSGFFFHEISGLKIPALIRLLQNTVEEGKDGGK